MGTKIKDEAPAVVIDGEDSQPPQSTTSFYTDTIPLLKIVMVLLAFGMEVGAGVAIHEAQRISENLGPNHRDLTHQRSIVRQRMSQLAQEIIALGNEPALFEAKFWRDFHWTLLKRSIGTLAKGVALGAFLFGLIPARASAQQPLDLVVLVDLSRSVGTTGPDEHSEFQKNIEALSQLLKQVPAGSKVAVVGITDDSFGRPYILLSAALTSEPGFFGEKLDLGRRQLQAAWKNRSRDLSPSFAGTDLIGALVVAGHIFDEHGALSRRVLVILSDMWQESRDFNFRGTKNFCDRSTSVVLRGPNAHLNSVNIYALGVESSGHSKQEWTCAHNFWVSYFAETGARLSRYTMLRDLQLSQVN